MSQWGLCLGLSIRPTHAVTDTQEHVFGLPLEEAHVYIVQTRMYSLRDLPEKLGYMAKFISNLEQLHLHKSILKSGWNIKCEFILQHTCCCLNKNVSSTDLQG